MNEIRLKNIIAPSFYNVHKLIKQDVYTHYWFKGGRGSTKSSFISLEIVLGMMRDAQQGKLTNAVVIRRVKDTLRGSVYEQIQWAIYTLGVQNEWEIPESKLQMTYKPTGQVILFKGADKPKKLKSTKVSKGYIKYVWYEEVDEFEGMDKIRNVNQSLLRGGNTYNVFYSFNPPESQRNWTNMEVLEMREDKFIHHSNYLSVPKTWLGEQFAVEAEHLKKVNPTKYEHDYIGVVTGTGGEVFTNVTVREISNEEINRFDRVRRGLDFGYAKDPLSYIVMNYDKTRKRLYIFFEIYKVALGNSKAVELILKENTSNKKVIADSAEPRTINEFKKLGLKISGARKGPDSVEHGIKFLSEEVEEIIIDPIRCPNAKREFLGYELEKDKEGNFKGEYPDKNNHTIDAVRYGMEDVMLKRKGLSILK
ncbi:PBSX family phage terminase, large subunit [Clostridioides difficile]|uniref:PBSX family phage terminase large subunit n=1 Tax=Clostridioides difficile TaxID=1496 RepID=UPI0009754766|nr:PBSX family phage terminase large subunit [Clostridioides difficile]MBZ1316508.1 PBSX family phage terminase large subunit [Clostridioides difficile]OMK81614.1 PBSX family phage terminase, large subunit [Clostridioides difficile]HBF5148190.1 PBSX family phage terminase large subunit [Clostridioides difficile]HBG6377171.1 PBSX family phage terminase large subunit [Clostridioides difficile]HBH3650265.1 PBSX family phage terminase large subunit [Clostridioides difficile]